MGLDIRMPIGLMFAIFGVLLAGYGLVPTTAIYGSLGLNVNLPGAWCCSPSGSSCWASSLRSRVSGGMGRGRSPQRRSLRPKPRLSFWDVWNMSFGPGRPVRLRAPERQREPDLRDPRRESRGRSRCYGSPHPSRGYGAADHRISSDRTWTGWDVVGACSSSARFSPRWRCW